MTVFTTVLTGFCAIILLFIIIVFYYACMWSIFKKAGIEGWWSVIPFANAYKFCEITWGNGLFFILLFIPGVNIVFAIITMVRLGLVFDRSNLFCVGLVLLAALCVPILALDNSVYVGIRN